MISSKAVNRNPDDRSIIAQTPDGGDQAEQKASKMQLQLLQSKKIIEKDLSEKLEEKLEQQDNLVSTETCKPVCFWET